MSLVLLQPVACLLDLCTGTIVSSYPTQSAISALPVGPSAAAAAAAGLVPLGCTDGVVRLLDIRVGALVSDVLPLVSPLSVSSLALSSSQLAVCGALPPGSLGAPGAPRCLEEALKRCCFLDLRMQMKALASVSLFPSSLPVTCLFCPGIQEVTPAGVAVSSDGFVLQVDTTRLSLLPPYNSSSSSNNNNSSSSSSSCSNYAEALAAGALEVIPIQQLQGPLMCAALDNRSSLLALCEWGGRVQLLQQQRNRKTLGDPLARRAAVVAAARRQQQLQQQQQQQQQQGDTPGCSSSNLHNNNSSSNGRYCHAEQPQIEGAPMRPLPGLDDFLLPPAAAPADLQHQRGPTLAFFRCSSYLQQQLQQQQLGGTAGAPLKEAFANEELTKEYQLLDALEAPRLRGPLVPCCSSCVRPGSCTGGPLTKGAPCCCELLSEKWVFPVSSLKREDGDTAAAAAWGPPPQSQWGAPDSTGVPRGPPFEGKAHSSGAAATEDSGEDLVCGMVLRTGGAPGGAPCWCNNKKDSSKSGDSRGSSGPGSVRTSWDEGPFGGPGGPPDEGGECMVEVLTQDDIRPPIPLPLALIKGTEAAGGGPASADVRFAANVLGCEANGALYGAIGSSKELVLRKTGGLLTARGGEGPLNGTPLRRSDLLAAQTQGFSQGPPWLDSSLGGPPTAAGGPTGYPTSGPSRGGVYRPPPPRGRWGPPGGPSASAGGASQHKPSWKRQGDSSGVCLSPSSSSASGGSDEDEAPTRHARALLRASKQQGAVGATGPPGAPPSRRGSACNSSQSASPGPTETGRRGLWAPDGGPPTGTKGISSSAGRGPPSVLWRPPLGAPPLCSSSNSTLRVPSRYAFHKLSAAPWMCGGPPGGPASSKLPPFGCFEGGGRRGFLRPLMQFLFFCPALTKALTLHACDRSLCIACEVGAVLHMLDLAR